jgi:predicted nucleotidyltransferase
MASPSRSLADCLFGKSRKSVLGALFVNPKPMHLRELARVAGVSPSMMSNELRQLVEVGIVLSERDGNRIQFRANPECPIFDELRGIARKTTGLLDVVREALAKEDIALAFIFGSMASGTDRPDSDVDLMIVSDADGLRLHGLVDEIEKAIRRPVHANMYGSEEWRDMLKDGVVQSIVDGPKIMVIGDDPKTAGI